MAADDRRLERIELKIDGLHDVTADINVTLAAQHENLKEHMKRSDALEAALKPVQRHVAMVEGALKLLGLLAVLATIFEALKSVLK